MTLVLCPVHLLREALPHLSPEVACASQQMLSNGFCPNSGGVRSGRQVPGAGLTHLDVLSWTRSSLSVAGTVLATHGHGW